MGKSQSFDVVHELYGHLFITQRAVAIFEFPSPTSEMYFVDRIGSRFSGELFSIVQPSLVLPGIRCFPNNRGSLRCYFCVKGKRVRLLQILTRVGLYGIFVSLAFPYPCKESFPYPRFVPPGIEFVLAIAPLVEVAD